MKIKNLNGCLVVIGASLAFSAVAQVTPSSDSNLPATGSSSTGNGPATSAPRESVIRGKDMKKLDKNQDGMVSKQEAMANKDWTKLFAEMDADSNGMISPAELVVLENRAKASDTTKTTPDDEKSDLGTPKK